MKDIQKIKWIFMLSMALVMVTSGVESKRLVFSNEQANTIDTGEFVIDVQDYESEIELKFGNNIDASIVFDRISNKFIINRDINVLGNVTFSEDVIAQGGKHILSTPWWNSTNNVSGYIKLITPIVHNEGNMFSLKITGYGYGAVGKSFTIDCSGYAYSGSSLLNAGCTTVGTNLPVELATEIRSGTEVIVIRIGTPTSNWYYQQFSVEYRGWQEKDATDFVWIKGETIPIAGSNMNKIIINDGNGLLATTGSIGAGTQNPTEKLHIAGNVKLDGAFKDKDGDVGFGGQVLASTVSGTDWITNSINPIPFVSNPFKKKISTSTTSTFTIEGELFTPTSTVIIPGFDGTIDTVNVISSTEMEVTLTPGTTVTLYDIIVSNGGVLNTSWANNGEDLLEVANLSILTPGNATTPWVRISTNVITSLQKILPTVATSGWNKGASFGTVPAATDFELSFNPVYMSGQSAGGYAMIGMDNSDPNHNYNTIDYAIYMQNGTNLYIYENGSSKGNHGSWTTTDLLSIRRTGSLIEYLKNGTVFYTSLTSSTLPMEFDSSLYRYLGAENIELVY